MQQAALSFADLIVRSPLVRWTWSGLAEQNFTGHLHEFRPTDTESVREMMSGRFLLASKLVETGDQSPFAIDAAGSAWGRALHEFAWLRHFQDTGEQECRFARTLVLDWIGRNNSYNAMAWAPAITAVRTLNWLRHLPLINEGATPGQKRTIARSLGTQLQSLKLRGGLVANPYDALYAAIALLGAALCDNSSTRQISQRIDRLVALLDQHVGPDGLHKSRSARVQIGLLIELATVRRALTQRHKNLAGDLGTRIDAMHTALGMLVMGSGEPAYFNGCGQMPVDLVIAVQAQSAARPPDCGVIGGYGRLKTGQALLIADSGQTPPPALGSEAHAGGLSFEFSHGGELLIGNCGPAPADRQEDAHLFRQGVAHCGPTIDGLSSARIISRGPHAGALRQFGDPPLLELNTEEPSLQMRTSGYAGRFGVILQRDIALIAGGDTLVGQDRVFAADRGEPKGTLTLRFHIAPGATVRRQPNEDLIQITTKSGARWTFLWEGGKAAIDESVRQSAYFGFFRTRQIVIETDVRADGEVSWIFTRQNG